MVCDVVITIDAPWPPNETKDDNLQSLCQEFHQIKLVGTYLLADYELYTEECLAINTNTDTGDVLSNVWNSLCHQHTQYLQIINNLTCKIPSAGASTPLFLALVGLHGQLMCFERVFARHKTPAARPKDDIAQILFKLLQQSVFVHAKDGGGGVDVCLAMTAELQTCLRQSIQVKLEQNQQTKDAKDEVISQLAFDPDHKVYRATLRMAPAHLDETLLQVDLQLLCGLNFSIYRTLEFKE